MNISKKLLALLAIFCIVASAGVVCAADNGTDDGWAGSQYQDNGNWAGSQYNETSVDHEGGPYIDPDYAHHEPAAGEPTNSTGNSTNATGNSTGHAAGELSNNTTNKTANPYKLPATGNPVLVLLGVSAILGGCAVLRRK